MTMTMTTSEDAEIRCDLAKQVDEVGRALMLACGQLRDVHHVWTGAPAESSKLTSAKSALMILVVAAESLSCAIRTLADHVVAPAEQARLEREREVIERAVRR